MVSKSAEPIQTTKGGIDGAKLNHPAFACLKVTRVNGGNEVLFGSPVKATSYVEVALHRAEGTKSGLSEGHFAREIIASVKMSETQWASLISRPNYGDGVPVTLEYGPEPHSKLMHYPDILRVSDSERRQNSINDALASELVKLKEALAKISEIAEAKGTISKPELREAIRNLDIVTTNAPKNFEYAANQVTKHMVEVEEAVRLDLDSFARSLGLNDGISGLLNESKDDDNGKIMEG